MRPRKTILVVNANEQELSLQKFMLETRGYRVLVAQDADAALALHAVGVDLVLGFQELPRDGWAYVAECMKVMHWDVPIVLIGPCDVGAANVAWCGRQMATAELLERVRLLIRRKRGPRKVVVALEPALALAGD
jgi:two-component system response regulator CpxR